ncbi:F-box/LRR-repeat protein At3g03360-like [Rhododendron vialii]|uniref:F-box/LRR-repeat protein At3g03360-like n=1 Tax=Rhododendron vialii TaxID=182163 RepID=UPI00265F7C61|nr:F-box/LRR-repeat protein At3g03360-like [Rhododendron vialii]
MIVRVFGRLFLQGLSVWQPSYKTGFQKEISVFRREKFLKKFGVDFGYEPRFTSNVNSWTRFAVGKDVEELCLEFHSAVYRLNADEFYELPQLLYANSRFKELRFSLCWVTPKGNVAWNSLNKLSIGYVELSEDVIERILAGSPVLEFLELHHCKGFIRFVVTNSCVKKLILRDFSCTSDYNEYRLEIPAPYLVSMEISDGLERCCRFMDVSSLVDAVFNYNLVLFDEDRAVDYERIQNMVVGLLASLAHVKNLTLGRYYNDLGLISES